MNLSEALKAREKNRDLFVQNARFLAGQYAIVNVNVLKKFSAFIYTPEDIAAKINLPDVILPDPKVDDKDSPFLAYAWASSTEITLNIEFIAALNILAETQGANVDVDELGPSTKNTNVQITAATFEF